MAFLFLSSANNRSIPRTPQEIISPAHVVSIKKGIVPSSSYTYFNIRGTTTVLDTIGGIGASHLFFSRDK